MTVGGDADDWDECDAFGRSDHAPETGFQGSALLGNFALHRARDSAIVDVDSPAQMDLDSGVQIVSPLPQPADSASPAPDSKLGTTPAAAAAAALVTASTPAPAIVDLGVDDADTADGWSCSTCTFKNKRRRKKCEMCGAPRPHDARSCA